MMQASFATASVVAKDPTLKLLETGASSSLTLSMWSDTPPFDKLEVRQALKKVVDREAMIKTALFGYGNIGNDNPVPPSSPFAFMSAPPCATSRAPRRCSPRSATGRQPAQYRSLHVGWHRGLRCDVPVVQVTGR